MLRGILTGSVVLGALVLAPLKIRARPGERPQLAVSQACAETGNCCFELQSLCILDGRVLVNMRSSDGRSCVKPKPGS